MIDVELWFVWCKGVVFGMIASVLIKEFGEWVRSRRTQRALDKCPHCENGIVWDGEFDKWFSCSICHGTGIRQ